MKRWIITGAFVVACLVVLGIFATGFGKDPHKVPFGMKGKQAPAFTLRDLATDKPVSLSDFKGKPVVINFWASWCEPCKAEHPYLEWAQREYGDRVAFVGMVFEDTPENARHFLSEHGAPFPELIDPNSMTSVAYGVAGVPETYFIDASGKIVDKFEGPIWPAKVAEYMKLLLGPDAVPVDQETRR